MLSTNFADPRRAVQAVTTLRIVIALLILAHGLFRLTQGGVAPFGTWLETQGFPAGHAWAMAVTLIEIAGPLCLLAGRLVTPVALIHAGILTLGMVLVHMPSGWFVVGPGRNGMEYSALLIVGLLVLAWVYHPVERA